MAEENDEVMFKTPCDFGSFRLEKELGHGGMGGVYLGRDTMLDRPVAIKVMLASLGSDPTFVERFKKEAQAAAKLQHPNIAQIYRFDIEQGRPYIAMEVCPGGSLDSDMEKNPGKLDVVRVMRIGEQMASALSIAAEAGLVHGDIKPENVLYDNDGNAKIVDFGLAAMQGETNEIWGTPYYISPEKCKKQKIDFRADIYSLGGTLYHALTGVPPFEGEDAVAVVKARFMGPPRKPSEIRPDIPPEVDAMIMRMLEVEPSRRHPTYQSLLGDFKRYLSKFPSVSSPGKAGGGKKFTIKGRKPKSSSTTGTVPSATQSVSGTTQQVAPALGRFDPSTMVEEQKEGMGIGKMVGIAIGGVVLAIVALVGGLLWWMHASTVSEEEEAMKTARGVMVEARNAAMANQKVAFEYCEKIKGCADSSEKDMREAIATLRGLLSEEHLSAYGDQLIPSPDQNQDMIDAIAFTNQLAMAKAPAKAAEPAAAAEAAPAAGAADAAKKDEAKEGEAKEGEAKEGEAKEGETAAEGEAAGGQEGGEQAQEGEGEAAAPEQPAVELPGSARDLIKMWDDAYLCRAAAIRVSARMDDLLAKADAMIESAKQKESEADSLAEDMRNERKALYEDAAQLYGQAGKMLKDTYDAVRGEKLNETAQTKSKNIGGKAKRKLEEIEKALIKQRNAAEKKRAAAEEAAREAAQKAEMERVKKEKEEHDIALAQTAFEDLIGGRLRQLSWEPAIARLKSVRGEMETVAGQDEVDFMIWKVEIMRDLQAHFIKFAAGTRFPNKVRTTIVSADQKKFTIQNHTWNARKGDFDVDPKTADIDWSRLYRASDEAYKGVRLDWILTKMLVQLVEKGRTSDRPEVRAALPLKVWTDRLLGAALTLKLLYSDKQGAPEYAAKLAKMAVKAFPDYADKKARKLFPDIDFDDNSGEEGAEGGGEGE